MKISFLLVSRCETIVSHSVVGVETKCETGDLHDTTFGLDLADLLRIARLVQ
jgi:hypothetical protein